MNESLKALSDIIIYEKYSKFREDLNRRETWSEIVDRYIECLIKKHCGPGWLSFYYSGGNVSNVPSNEILEEGFGCEMDKYELYFDILKNSKFIYDKKILMSMRAAQFAGPAIERNESRMYNCAYLPVDDYRAFSEIMFLLLGGTGVGFSIQKHDIDKLPEIRIPRRSQKFLISDSIEGWADSIKALMAGYLGKRDVKPIFNYDDIRPKGSRLITAGGKAPGPDPLRICHVKIQAILNRKSNGEQLTPLECHDIICHIADAVLAGGIRRAALISLFSFDDKEMATCKYGSWWELNSQRGRSNNSAVIVRNRIKKEEFDKFWELIKDSGSGEPGIFWTNDPSYGTNPCCEINLRPFTFCNLNELNAGSLVDPNWPLNNDLVFEETLTNADALTAREDFLARARVEAFFGTLQAGFTDFHYLRPIWRKNTEKDALIGASITGICNGDLKLISYRYPDILDETAHMVLLENARVSKMIGINLAARTTTIKPSGTSSLVLGVSSGIHAWHSKFYIRNIQCAVGSDLYNYFVENHPELIKIMDYDESSAVIGIPVKSPNKAVLRKDDPAIDMLERVKWFNQEWIKPGHRKGPNTNNVSATISIDANRKYLYDGTEFILDQLREPANMYSGNFEIIDEWEAVKIWMWNNKNFYNGLAVLPYDGGTYKDAPFQECTREEYERRMEFVREIDLTKITENDDNTNLSGEIACGPDGCEIK